MQQPFIFKHFVAVVNVLRRVRCAV